MAFSRFSVIVFLVATLFLQVAQPASAGANTPQIVGHYRAFTNDFLGDGRDRWRSASYQLSWVGGNTDFQQRGFPNWTATEYRLRAEIITPSNLTAAVSDRPYVETVGVAWIRHYNLGKNEVASGIEVNFTGPQTGLAGFQDWVHNIIGAPAVTQATGQQIGNNVWPAYTGQIARTNRFKFGNFEGLWRPFGEVKLGVENYVRAGIDVIAGYGVSADLLIRDDTTGIPLTGIKEDNEWGFSTLVGVDIAAVHSSRYLPENRGYRPERLRGRARIGFLLEGRRTDFFWGLTHLTPEFRGQGRGQTLGTIYLHANF